MDVVGGLQKVVYGKTQQDHDYFYLRVLYTEINVNVGDY